MASDPRIGTELGGYRIESLIGRGGMSVVYLAEDLSLRRKVALKLLAPELAEDERFRERFVRESQLAASLDHPNIVPIFEAREHDGALYIAMRYVEGTDLKRLIQAAGPLDPERTVWILSQVASALDAAHARGLVHRDVKPGNILIAAGSGREHVYLSDFGLTKRTSSDSGITGTGQFLGTLDYAAPEQFEGQALDARADIYSLGCVLYECLSGEPPYLRETDAALVFAHIQAPPPKVTEARPELPQAVDAVVRRGMAKDPKDRYQTAGAMIDEAGTALGRSDRGGAPPPTGRRPGRTRGILIGGVAALVAVAVVAGVLVFRERDGGTVGAPSPTPGAGGTDAPIPLVDFVARVDPATGRVTQQVKAGKDPAGVVIAEGSAWVANNGDDTVSRIDPVTVNVQATIDVVNGPFIIAAGEGGVWVAGRGSSVSEIDPATNGVNAMDVGVHPEAMTVGEGALWVAYTGEGGTQGVIDQLDPNTGRLIHEVIIPEAGLSGPTGARPWGMAAGAGALWAGGVPGIVYRVDPHTGTYDRFVSVGSVISAIAVQGDTVWVGAMGTPGKVFDVNPQTAAVSDPIPAGGAKIAPVFGETLHLAADDHQVWVTDAVTGAVTRIVILSGQASPAVDIGEVPTDVAIGLGSVWVTVDGSSS
jgi:serine/threonine-protein kinase